MFEYRIISFFEYRHLNKNTPCPWWGRQACRGTTSIRRFVRRTCSWQWSAAAI